MLDVSKFFFDLLENFAEVHDIAITEDGLLVKADIDGKVRSFHVRIEEIE